MHCEEHPVHNSWVMRCRCGYLCGVRCRLFAYGPADATASPNYSVYERLLLLLLLHPFNGVVMGGVLGCSGISWTVRKQSAHRCRQITTPASHHSIFTGQILFLIPNQQCQSTEGNSPSVNPCYHYYLLIMQHLQPQSNTHTYTFNGPFSGTTQGGSIAEWLACWTLPFASSRFPSLQK